MFKKAEKIPLTNNTDVWYWARDVRDQLHLNCSTPQLWLVAILY